MKTGTIYGLLCPIAKKIVYVGQTTLGLKNKLALSKTHVDGEYGNWIIQLTTSGLLNKLEIVPLQRNVPTSELTEREKFWIAFCNKQHPLINKNFNPSATRRGKLGAHALFRFFILDRAFIEGNSTLENLTSAVTSLSPNAEFSKRTIQLDIEEMRHNEDLKFYAPIEYNRLTRVYFYSDPNYSLLKLIEKRFYNTEILKAA